MIILLYLIVISGWALLILIIKCRKAREKRIAMEMQQAQINNAVHVIQIGNTFYDVIPITRCQYSHSRCRGFHIRQSDSTSSLSSSSNPNSHGNVNPTFSMIDEGVFPSAPAPSHEMPPSYDEVIRLPNQYPKRDSVHASRENLPPPTIEEIEGSHSITTITSQTPAIITQPPPSTIQSHPQTFQTNHSGRRTAVSLN